MDYWYGPTCSASVGTCHLLHDALGIAAGINECSRQTDVIAMANYAQTVNVIGAINTSKTAAILDSTGEALVMYRRHFGTIPVEITGAPEPLDVATAGLPTEQRSRFPSSTDVRDIAAGVSRRRRTPGIVLSKSE